jgi:hypothetical protein
MISMTSRSVEESADMTLHAIPTECAHTQFRSRLEARWARFFDLVGWRWEYEPFDLSGWIPDFALIGVSQTTLVEVKPVASLDDPIAKEACEKAERAVLRSGHRDEILLLGYTWPERHGDVGLGWLNEWCFEFEPFSDDGEVFPSCDLALFHTLGGLGFHPACNTFSNRMTGEHDGTCGAFAAAPIGKWREAGNTVQWVPARR